MKTKLGSKYSIKFSGLSMMGVALAMILSYDLNHSIGWAILHGFLSWIYVIVRLF